MAGEIRLARVQRTVVTENHGCDAEAGWFAVGSRTLNAGERVGVVIPAKLLGRLCARRSATCRPVAWIAHVTFPTNCWNLNLGAVLVSVFVRRERGHKRVVKHFEESAPAAPVIASPPPASPPVPAPSNAAIQSCALGGGVDVTLANASTATGPASFVLE